VDRGHRLGLWINARCAVSRRLKNSECSPVTPVVASASASYPRAAELSADRRAPDASVEWVRPGPYKPAPVRRGKGRPRKYPTPAVFYGYPAELIAQWCGVAMSTAHAYKNGRRKPGASVVRLFELHRDRRVLPPEWKGWLVKPDAIVDPEGNETSRNLLRMYRMMLQYSHDLASRTGDERDVERYWELLKAA